jgi:hypothetical protein
MHSQRTCDVVQGEAVASMGLNLGPTGPKQHIHMRHVEAALEAIRYHLIKFLKIRVVLGRPVSLQQQCSGPKSLQPPCNRVHSSTARRRHTPPEKDKMDDVSVSRRWVHRHNSCNADPSRIHGNSAAYVSSAPCQQRIFQAGYQSLARSN